MCNLELFELLLLYDLEMESGELPHCLDATPCRTAAAAVYVTTVTPGA